jgi:hypothetical protein
MKSPVTSFRRKMTALLLVCSLLTAGFAPVAAGSDDQERARLSERLQPPRLSGLAVLAEQDDKFICRGATADENRQLARTDEVEMLALNAETAEADEGINIILRGTAQLESFPAARAAFLRAANRWRSLIRTPVTVVIDVDFGPTRFGRPYPRGVIGSTGSQELGAAGLYPLVRRQLLAGAINAQKRALYDLLPENILPTDQGETDTMLVPSILLRAIGLLPPVYDPALERGLGSPPSIGFNSAFPFDFDPGDGVTLGRIDFDAVAIHEIGHALGFTSNNGLREIADELEIELPLFASVWDMFRINAGLVPVCLRSGTRVLKSGVAAEFMTLDGGIAVANGGLIGDRGDFAQSSHWKSEFDNGNLIGVMDPFSIPGLRRSITVNDVKALDAFGYDLNPEAVSTLPVITSLKARLDGELVTITGAATDGDADLRAIQFTYYTKDGAPTLIFLSQFPASFTSGANATFTAAAPLPSFLISAILSGRISVVVVDSKGNTSPGLTADFSEGDHGGAIITDAILYQGRLIIRGRAMAGKVKLEVNGEIVNPPALVQADADNDVVRTFGSADNLGLFPGPNRIRLSQGGRWSNIFILNLPDDEEN